jgi:hypothetical protein
MRLTCCRVTQNRDVTTGINIINALNYKKVFGDHGFAVDLIQEAYRYKYDALGAQGEGFTSSGFKWSYNTY